MKKQLIIALAFSISAFSFAQKKELKTAEKAVKKQNFAAAQEALKQAEGLMDAMDDNQKSQYYYLNTAALFANGKGNFGEVKQAINSFSKIKEDNNVEAKQLKNIMYNDFLTKANNAYKNENYKAASFHFERAYQVSPRDTTFLYNAGMLAVNVKDYDRGLKIYEDLMNLGYTGISKEILAVNKATGKSENFPNKDLRSASIKTGTHNNPSESLSESKRGQIIRDIALIYTQNGDSDKALDAIKRARVQNPDDVDLIINEASIYLKKEDFINYERVVQEALVKQPDNKQLQFNIGVVKMNKGNLIDAKKAFEKVLSLDSSYSNAALNLSNIYIEHGNALVPKMSELGTSKADDIKYEAFKKEKAQFFNQGANVLTSFIEKNPNPDSNILLQLKNIYNALNEVEKAKAIQAKIDLIEGGN